MACIKRSLSFDGFKEIDKDLPTTPIRNDQVTGGENSAALVIRRNRSKSLSLTSPESRYRKRSHSGTALFTDENMITEYDDIPARSFNG